MLHRSSERYSVRVVEGEDAILVYDLYDGVLECNLSDYAQYLIDDRHQKVPQVLATVYALCRFLRALSKARLGVDAVDTKFLKLFRKADRAEVLANCRSFASRKCAEDTVNKKLVCVYKWLLWLQDRGRIRPYAIGPQEARVKCGFATLNEQERYAPKRKGARILHVYPLLFPDKRGYDRHAVKPRITREQHETMVENFMSASQPEYVRLRNTYIAEIGTEVGFRRDSICSLTEDQFDKEKIRSCNTDTIKIKPARQKLDYQKAFHFPLSLALNICDFIEGPLKEIKKQKGIRGKTNLFLSSRDGRPLTSRAITKILSHSCREVGAQKGTATHATRRLFAVEKVAACTDERIAKGMDSSAEQVAKDVSLAMGHTNWESVLPYVNEVAMKSILERQEEQRQMRQELRKLRAENLRLQAELKMSMSAKQSGLRSTL